ncbi:SGNH/GDSL hydrolase family protein [Pseudoneobacillus sp. C159]
MKRIKAILLIASLLVGGLFLYLFFPGLNESSQTTSTPSSPLTEKTIEKLTEAIVVEEETAEEGPVKNDLPITEEIKEKVRAVLEGAFNFFKKDQKIVAIGDSLTQGVGDETGTGGYVGILQNTFDDHHLNISIENFGKRGNRSDQLLKRLEQKSITTAIKKSDIVLITIGANDIMRVVKTNFTHLNSLDPFIDEREYYTERLRSIFNKINELNPDAQIYLIGFYNPFERYFSNIEQLNMIMTNWNDAGKSVTEEYANVEYIPIDDIFIPSEVDLLSDDYFHPNTSGYKLIAKRVLENLKEFSEEETDVLPIEESE